MKKIIYGLMTFAPVIALAQGVTTAVGTATSLAQGFSRIINILIPAIFGLAIVYFFYGLAKYILAGSSDPKQHENGKQIMIYGVIAIAVMASIYGIVGFLQNTLGITGGSTNIQLPIIESR